MKKIISLFIMTLVIISCSSDNNIQIDNSDLIGKWNWTNTDGGIGFNVHGTPEKSGKIIHLNLKTNFKYSIIENGSEISNGTYKLAMKKSIYSEEMEIFIAFSENQQKSEIVTNGIIKTNNLTELNISDNNYDGIRSNFIKIE